MGNLTHLSRAQTRSISPENFTGEKGRGATATEGTGAHRARELGRGWKVSPSVVIRAGTTFEMADISGLGVVQHIWLTPTGNFRFSILRIYWDDQPQPSVECPVGDFFATGWGRYAQLSSLAVCVNPGSGFNAYWAMPFRRRCRITLTNIGDEDMTLYYQVTYALADVPLDAAYFHAQFRRNNPLPFGEVHTLVDGVKGHGHHVGTYLAWGPHAGGWWGVYQSQMRFGMYRWHIVDPIRLERLSAWDGGCS